MSTNDVSTLRVAQLIPSTEAEGPGRRFAIWTQGCPLGCPGCCNPQMLAPTGGRPWSVAELGQQVLQTDGIEGITLLGGEPLVQAAACAELCQVVRDTGLSVMLFTGYTLQELRAPEADAAWGRLLSLIDLLVDGRYNRRQPEQARRWIGSTNQGLHFLSRRYRPEQPCFSQANTVEIRLDARELTINGWPDLARRLMEHR